jgi:hypothetical protein
LIVPLWPVVVIAGAYLIAHLPFLAPSLEDYDSINFALGLREFNPALHQPHPPGSPVYIALGRALLAVISLVGGSLRRTSLEALTLALWSAFAGAIALAVLVRVFGVVCATGHKDTETQSHATRFVAVALVAVAPLFWISGLRPLSDLPGLAAALVAQALILGGPSARGMFLGGAFIAGLAAGIRVQTVLLTVPPLVFMLVRQPPAAARGRRAATAGAWLGSVAALATGGLVWAVPLVVVTGGINAYLRALGSQAGEDFAWVNMLWLEPTPRRLVFALYETFVLPWGSTPLAAAVAVSAAAGALIMLVRARRELALLLALFAPYVLFHLLFQDTIMVRYALPTLPLVAWCAARGLSAAGRAGTVATLGLLTWALALAVPTAAAYGRSPHPAFQAIDDAARYATVAPPVKVFAHESIWRALQADNRMLPVVEPRRQYEWLGPVSYWKDGGADPIWFLADPRRTDLDLIDPEARRDVVRYPWAVAVRPELSGTRPLGADWYRLQPPGWFAGEGWSLTPETGGLTRATGSGPDARPIEAWVRRRDGPLHLVVGGRHLGAAGDPSAEFELAVDGTVRDRWTLTFEQRNFLRFVEIPSVRGDGRYARLTIVSQAAGADSRRAPVGIRQFDIQSADRLLYGFAEGWHEEEYDAFTGRRWRWTSERSVLRVAGPPTDVRLTLRGESPLRYFDVAPTVKVTAGGRVIDQLRPDTDFEWTVVVPSADVMRAAGAIAIETDRVYLPGPVEGTSDERHLALRIYECRVSAASN